MFFQNRYGLAYGGCVRHPEAILQTFTIQFLPAALMNITFVQACGANYVGNRHAKMEVMDAQYRLEDSTLANSV